VEYSPILALATGIFECVLAFFALFSPGRKRILHPVALLLLLLAGYQFAEIAVCSHPDNLLFTRVAFFDITWLPPVALWLLFQLSSPKRIWWKYLVAACFVLGSVLVLWILLDPAIVTKSVCQVVIARYDLTDPFHTAYGGFYHLGMLGVIFGSAAAMANADDKVIRRHLANLQTGILGFVLPSLILQMLMSQPAGAMPSVMCHFALILAVSFTFLIFRERRFDSRSFS
jgi:hypothetical protein